MLHVTFVRKRGHRDHVFVTRADGSATDWAFPSYGDGLPHDLCHLVVEAGLGLTDGFWGLVERHVEVGLVNNQATLLRDGRPLIGQPGVDFRGLVRAEAAVALLASTAIAAEQIGELTVARLAGAEDRSGPAMSRDSIGRVVEHIGADLPDSATPDVLAAIRTRLAELAVRWRALEDGQSISLEFDAPR